MQSILAWMRRNPRAARQLMWKNESFIFFNETPFVGTGPLGAQGVELMPGRSLAVDPSVWPFGTPIWLDTRLPAIGEHHSEEFRHLLVAQDAGSAILGAARGDIYFGHGEVAAMQAGAMKSSGRMFVLLPREAPA
jgi:membrane-bound lytic murein transglycosylase A